jgi:hypothetical protein
VRQKEEGGQPLGLCFPGGATPNRANPELWEGDIPFPRDGQDRHREYRAALITATVTGKIEYGKCGSELFEPVADAEPAKIEA